MQPRVQLDSQGGGPEVFVAGDNPHTGKTTFTRFAPPQPRDDKNAGARKDELELGDELIREGMADLKQRAAELRKNGVTLPKDQADALLASSRTVLAIFSEKIYAAAQRGEAKAVFTLIEQATLVAQETQYTDGLKSQLGRGGPTP